jgi:hypothetical protein
MDFGLLDVGLLDYGRWITGLWVYSEKMKIQGGYTFFDFTSFTTEPSRDHVVGTFDATKKEKSSLSS